MAEHEFVCVGTYPAETLAELARMRLEESGIESFISSDDCGGMLPLLQASAGVRLSVRGPDAEFALRVLARADVESGPSDAGNGEYP